MNRKQLVQEIYRLSHPNKWKDDVVKLDIDRGTYVIKNIWSRGFGSLVTIIYKNGNFKSQYLDKIRVHDQIFIYRYLLRLDIYREMKKISQSTEDITRLTDYIFKSTTKNNKIVNRK